MFRCLPASETGCTWCYAEHFGTLLNTALWVGLKTNGVAGAAGESEKYTLHASMSYDGADLLLFRTAGTLNSELSVSASTLNEDKVKAVYSNFAKWLWSCNLYL
jgi:uncharacterized glyoxalase superfamily protein PhnB